MKSINLLPDDLAKQERARQTVFFALAIAMGFIALLALVTIWRQTAVSNREDDVEVERSINTSIEADVAALADAELVQEAFQQEAAKLEAALRNDVSWATLLNDLGRLIPDQVWLETFAGTSNFDPLGGSTAGLGEVSVNGTAFTDEAVANWLRTLDSDRFSSVTGTWVTNLSATTLLEVPVVQFSSATLLSPGAITRRFEERLPDVPL